MNSWSDGEIKSKIMNFVKRVTDENSPDFLPPDLRIAVFDNDGTLWCEKPLPIQADFLFKRLGQMVHDDPNLKDTQPWKAINEKDFKWLGAVIEKHYKGDDSDLKVMAGGLLQAYENYSIEQFEKRALEFFKEAQHPSLHRSYLECVYQPMIELLRYLEFNGFTNYIVTGGGRDFARVVSSHIYGIPSQYVIGSSVALEYEDHGDHAEIVHKAKLDLFDDGVAKPVRIWSRIGKRPILAVGNSNGDIPMLHFCDMPGHPSLSLLIDHDDSQREFSYQSGAEEALKSAKVHGWSVISIKRDWKEVFPKKLNVEQKAA